MAALRRLRLIAREATAKDRVIIEATPTGLTLLTESEDGRAVERIEDDLQVPDEEFAIAFNAGYVLETLAVMNTTYVTVEMTQALSPAVVRPSGEKADDLLVVVMPMQIVRSSD